MGTTPTRVSTTIMVIIPTKGGITPMRVSTMGTTLMVSNFQKRVFLRVNPNLTFLKRVVRVPIRDSPDLVITSMRGGTTLMRDSIMVSNFQKRVFLIVNPNPTFLKRVVRVPIRDSPYLVIFLREITQSFSREKFQPILLKLIHLIKGKFQMVLYSKLVTRVHVSHSLEDKDPFP
jgi:hypothetical protein